MVSPVGPAQSSGLAPPPRCGSGSSEMAREPDPTQTQPERSGDWDAALGGLRGRWFLKITVADGRKIWAAGERREAGKGEGKMDILFCIIIMK